MNQAPRVVCRSRTTTLVGPWNGYWNACCPEHESCVHEQTRELRLEVVALRAELQRENGPLAEASQDEEVTAVSSESDQNQVEAKSSCLVEHAFSPRMSQAVRVPPDVATNHQASCKSDDVSVVSSGLRQKFSNSWFSRHWSFSSLGSGVPFGGRPRRSSSSEWERFQMEHILLQSPHGRPQTYSRTIEETISLAEQSWKQGHRSRSDELIFNLFFDKHTQDLVVDSFGGIVVVINTLTIGLSVEYDEWAGWKIVDVIFALIFTFEMLLKMWVQRAQ